MDVAGEGIGVFGSDGEESAGFENFAGELEGGGGSAGLRCEGFEFEEGDFGFGEEGGAVGVVTGGL